MVLSCEQSLPRRNLVVRVPLCNLFIVLLLAARVSHAADPVHQQIDRLIEAKITGPVAPRSPDAEFIRRVTLDLAGRIPTADETRSFLQDDSKDKREALIERLLSGPEYATAMAGLFNVMLMERRGENADWDRFLKTSFAANQPWNELVRQILLPSADNEESRGSAWFYKRRLEKSGQQPTDYAGLTRDVGRLFLGVDLQCAECHDHLMIDDYKQQEFQGLFSVYKNVSIRNEKFPAINEKSITEKLEFISVFGSEHQVTGPRIPFGAEFEIPPPPEEQPKKKPDPNAPPAFSSLKLIAANLPSPENSLFCRNSANRIWFALMGQGLVEPLDQFHSDNQATHPEVLNLLATEFAAHEFDLKWLLRQIILSETYQRSSRTSEETIEGTYARARLRRLTADQHLASLLVATGNLQRLLPSESEPSEQYTELQKEFLSAFAAEPKEPALSYAPAVKQALFQLNESQFLNLLTPQENNLTERISKLQPRDVIDECFLSIFSRLPTVSERELAIDQIPDDEASRAARIQRLVWAMLTSIEFAVNH